MREILFRGKTTDRGEWVQGCYTETLKYNNMHWIWDGKNHFTVNPETIGQYTGLNDKNGNKVFENDIVVFGLLPCVVKYDLSNGRYMFYENGIYLKNGFNIDTIKTKEVIGNIHDNPELLGSK